MTQANNNKPTLTDIAQQVEQVNQRSIKIEQELKETNNRVEIYQKASTQVVNLAFSLITSATVTVIITSVLRK